MAVAEEQEMKAMRKREAMLHHLVLASTLTFPLEPVVLPLHGRASMAAIQRASSCEGHEAPSRGAHEAPSRGLAAESQP